jgi:hypothetical protein
MRRFIYFVKGLSGSPSRAQCIAASKLDYAFPKGESFATCEMRDGPLGAGVLAACGDGLGLSYDPATMTAELISEGVYVIVSRIKALVPGPDELQRSTRSVDGYSVTLADGNDWFIPVVRFLDGNTQLPQVIMRKPNGKATWDVKPEYLELVRVADRIVKDLLDGEQTAYDPDEMLWFCTQALQLNYRIGEAEIAAMGLIDSGNVREIANAALDGPKLAVLMDEFKKKQNVPVLSGVASAIGASA